MFSNIKNKIHILNICLLCTICLYGCGEEEQIGYQGPGYIDADIFEETKEETVSENEIDWTSSYQHYFIDYPIQEDNVDIQIYSKTDPFNSLHLSNYNIKGNGNTPNTLPYLYTSISVHMDKRTFMDKFHPITELEDGLYQYTINYYNTPNTEYISSYLGNENAYLDHYYIIPIEYKIQNEELEEQNILHIQNYKLDFSNIDYEKNIQYYTSKTETINEETITYDILQLNSDGLKNISNEEKQVSSVLFYINRSTQELEKIEAAYKINQTQYDYIETFVTKYKIVIPDGFSNAEETEIETLIGTLQDPISIFNEINPEFISNTISENSISNILYEDCTNRNLED